MTWQVPAMLQQAVWMQNIADHVPNVAFQVPQAEQGAGTAALGGIFQAGVGQIPLPASNAVT